jgi:hypothetical protein
MRTGRVELERAALELRSQLDPAFAEDTRATGTQPTTPSAGHCAVVALIVREHLGGELVSTHIDGQSHWYNRLTVGDRSVELDLTGDQFGLPKIQLGPCLYPDSRVRNPDDVHPETWARAALLWSRTAPTRRDDARAQ